MHGLCDFWLEVWNLAEDYRFMCLLNVDMEPSRNILGYRDISGFQNSHQLKPELKNFKPEVVFKKHSSILWIDKFEYLQIMKDAYAKKKSYFSNLFIFHWKSTVTLFVFLGNKKKCSHVELDWQSSAQVQRAVQRKGYLFLRSSLTSPLLRLLYCSNWQLVRPA